MNARSVSFYQVYGKFPEDTYEKALSHVLHETEEEAWEEKIDIELLYPVQYAKVKEVIIYEGQDSIHHYR